MVGPHMNICHLDEGALDWLIATYAPQTFLDIGCGTMLMVELALTKNLVAYGLDGDTHLLGHVVNFDRLIMCNLNESQFVYHTPFDLIWSVETAEHIELQAVDNYLYSVRDNLNPKGIYVMTHALPGSESTTHRNCQEEAWWIDQFKAVGLAYLPEATKALKQHSTMTREFIQNTGKVFCDAKYKGELNYG